MIFFLWLESVAVPFLKAERRGEVGKSASPLKRKTFCVRLHSLPAFSANSAFTFIWLVVAQTHVCFCVLGYCHITKEREADFVCVSLCFHYEGGKKPQKTSPMHT